MVRFTSSGTEATMSALRVARAATERDRVIKFAGCYHGHADGFLVEAGSGALTLGVPTSPGVAASTAALTLTAQFNDIASRRARCSRPTPRRSPPSSSSRSSATWASCRRSRASSKGCAPRATRTARCSIFDEVMTGFRVAPGGAQALVGVKPDLTCLGKIIGGGLPVGAYGGRADLMSLVAPAGPVYQAGTLSGNPLAITAGLWSLEQLSGKLYRHLERVDAGGSATACSTRPRAPASPLQVNRVGSMLTPFFTATPVRDYATACQSDTAQVRAVLPGPARARRLSAGVAVRGVVPVGGAHRAPTSIARSMAARAVLAEIGRGDFTEALTLTLSSASGERGIAPLRTSTVTAPVHPAYDGQVEPRAPRVSSIAIALAATPWPCSSATADRARARDANPATDAHLQQAFALAYNLDHDAAVTAMRAVIAEDPSNPAPYRALATVTWLNLLFKRGMVLVEHYLGPVSRSDVKIAAPPSDAARVFQENATARRSRLPKPRCRRAPNDPDGALRARHRGRTAGIVGGDDRRPRARRLLARRAAPTTRTSACWSSRRRVPTRA